MFLASGEFNYRRVQNFFEGIAFAIDIYAVPLRPFPFAFPLSFSHNTNQRPEAHPVGHLSTGLSSLLCDCGIYLKVISVGKQSL